MAPSPDPDPKPLAVLGELPDSYRSDDTSRVTPSEARPDTPREPLTRVGRYLTEEEIGQGGMGRVLRARDPVFNRPLAVKVLLEEHQHRPEMVRRFVEEAQVMGQLQHPGVPPVHEVGLLPDGRPYFTMKLIQGRTLAHILRERKSPADELAHFVTIFGQVCEALACAHSGGVIHRDLKPLNVMVGAFGEVQVMDWGLAKVLGRSETELRPPGLDALDPSGSGHTPHLGMRTLKTQSGDVMGTPAYMPPEQAWGEADRLDERCDVFGLGAMLCEILTGQPPFRGGDNDAVYAAARQGLLDDAFARLDACGADVELIQLARKCLAPQREDRPRDAAAVSRAVAAYREDSQRRLRQAELDKARADVKAQEQRKSRLTVIVSVVVLLVVLGVGLTMKDLHDRADEDLQAVEPDPWDARNHYVLGNYLKARGQLKEAVHHYRRAVQCNPELAEAHCNLGHALRDLTQFEEALSCLKRGHDLGSKQPGWRHPSGPWVEHCAGLLARDGQLSTVLRGQPPPPDAGEQLALAEFGWRYRQCYVAVTRLYTEAFAARPETADDLEAGHRHSAASAATLAAAGKGTDSSHLNAIERTRLRGQALAWLRADLAVMARLIEKGPPQSRQGACDALQHWQKAEDLNSVRAPEELAKLPVEERKLWQRLWDDVAALLRRV